jgi:hypothetical protein
MVQVFLGSYMNSLPSNKKCRLSKEEMDTNTHVYEISLEYLIYPTDVDDNEHYFDCVFQSAE